MSLLSNIDSPENLKELSIDELLTLAVEIREYIIEVIPNIGGHFASSLGVVELTIALHYLYDTPRDKITWDVGHQGYVHKILTGRKDALKNIRQYEGISGFLSRDESPFDVFGAGHASTSISSALGIAKARDLMDKKFRVVAVIGDGGMTGGLAYEGLNNAGAAGTDITVVLNDNNMSISKNVGAISKYLVTMVTNPFFQKLRGKVWELTGKMPKSDSIRLLAHRIEESFKTFVIPGMFFEDLGFTYYGPIDGHDLKEVINVLSNIKDLPGPKLVHFLTTKGKGCDYAEEDPIKYHGVKAPQKPGTAPAQTPTAYTKIFGDTMIDLAEKDKKVCVITAAMKEGTGLVEFAEKFPDRFFDVGIAEGHGVTFSGGLATEGMKPVAAIYSTFLQRAYDHIIHDISLQRLPVVFAMDRAGLVGEDGPTHHGNLDVSYLGCIPGMVITAPKNGTELRHLLYTGIEYEFGPFAIRYPRENTFDIDWDVPYEKLPIGSWEQLSEGSDVLILAAGTMVTTARTVSDILKERGLKTGVVNARFIKPIDEKFLLENAEEHDFIVTIEENVLSGGLGDRVSRFFMDQNWQINNRLLKIGVPDRFITHGARKILLEIAGLTPEIITQRIEEYVTNNQGKLLKQLF